MYRSNTTIYVIATFVVLVLLLSVGGCVYRTYGTDAQVTFTVKRLERVVQNSDDGTKAKYLVFTKEGEVFENTDTILRAKKNSSDLYGQLDVGKKFTCTVNGWRVPLFSWYRNLLHCKEVV